MTVRKPEPAEILYKGFRFLITDRPSDIFMDKYVDELRSYKVKELIRVCEATYDIEKLTQSGINVTDLPFDDGSGPPAEVVERFFELVKQQVGKDDDSCVAVHCVAGLGRAPVMVAIAMIELGMSYEDAVEMIRKKRRGAINSRQLTFLEKYRPKGRFKSKNSCCVM